MLQPTLHFIARCQERGCSAGALAALVNANEAKIRRLHGDVQVVVKVFGKRVYSPDGSGDTLVVSVDTDRGTITSVTLRRWNQLQGKPVVKLC